MVTPASLTNRVAVLQAVSRIVSLVCACGVASGPLQVSVGEEGPGYMPWSGSGESWVGWCYPYPRPVQVANSPTLCTCSAPVQTKSCVCHSWCMTNDMHVEDAYSEQR